MAIDIQKRIEGAVYGAFVADSLALGVHWVYNTEAIDKKVGRVTDLMAPIVKTFHPDKDRGELTHYGDQMLLFLRHVVSSGGFKSDAYITRWREFYKSYDGYKDHAMQETAANLETGKTPFGSNSTDLAAVLYLPGIAVSTPVDGNAFDQAVEKAVRMTHDNDQTVEAVRYVSRVLVAVLGGSSPGDALRNVLQEGTWSAEARKLITKGLDSVKEDTRTVIGEFGQACPLEHGLPGICHLISAYSSDIESGLIENVMAGGDSAARGIAAGAVLGAAVGKDGIPKRWLDDLVFTEEIDRLLE